jgi:hypothetical protein
MVSVGKVWDRTVEVIAGRFAILAAIALLLLIAPPVVQAVIDALAGTSPALKFVGGLVSLVVFLAAIIGTLAITAVATDPAVDRQSALAIGGARIGPMLGIMIVLGLALLVSIMPGVLLLGTSGFDVDRARAGLSQDRLDVGRAGLAMLYFGVIAIVWFWLGARLVPLLAVVVNERLGLGALRRSFDLSRGSTLKLVGVLILYAIVLLVVLLAATSIVGLIVRLIVGADGLSIVLFATTLVTAVVTAVFSVLQAAFSGQFYIAARDRRGPA